MKLKETNSSRQTNQAVIKENGPHPYEHDQLIAQLPTKNCAYLFLNFQFTTEDKRLISKTVFVLWTPLEAPSKTKFLYCSNKASILKVFQVVQFEFQADSASDVTFDKIKQKIIEKGQL